MGNKTTANSYEGKACRTCKGTERYTTNNRCVRCSRNAAQRSAKKAREGRADGANSMAPRAPDRYGWPKVYNADGDKVHPDPIAYLNLGNAGKFQ